MNGIVKKYSVLVIFFLLLVTQLSGQFYYGTQMTFGKNRVQFNDFYWYFYRYEKFDAYFNQSGKNPLTGSIISKIICTILFYFNGINASLF